MPNIVIPGPVRVTFEKVNQALSQADADIDINGEKITNSAAATARGDLVNYELARRYCKDPVRLCGTFITTDPPTGPHTMDGEAVVTGDRVLIDHSTTAVVKGIWVVNTAGPWTRPIDWQAGDHAEGTGFYITSGNSRAGQRWHCSNVGPNDVIGTDELFFAIDTVGGISPAPVSGGGVQGTAYGDAVANTALECISGYLMMCSNGTQIAAFRDDSSQMCLYPGRTESALGFATPDDFYYLAWKRANFHQLNLISTVVAYSATPTFNINDNYVGSVREITLTGNITSYTVTAPDPLYGAAHALFQRLVFKQDGTGGRTIGEPPANVVLKRPLVLSTMPDAVDFLDLVWDRFDEVWREAGRQIQDELLASDKWKAPVRARIQANQAGPYTGLFVVDGSVSLIEGDRVYVTEIYPDLEPRSGIWIAHSGDWTRALDWPVGADVGGSIFLVQEGDVYGQKIMKEGSAAGPVIVDTDTPDVQVAVIAGFVDLSGYTVYADSAGSGIASAGPFVIVRHTGTDSIYFRRGIGEYLTVYPASDYSRIGNANLPFGRALFREYGTPQYDYPNIGTPAIDAVANTGANDGEQRGYKIVAMDKSGYQFDLTASQQGGFSPASPEVQSAADGPTTLDGSNYVTITWTDIPDACWYDIYLTSSTVGGEVLGKVARRIQAVQTFNHTGEVGDGSTPPTNRSPKIVSWQGACQVIELDADIDLSFVDGGGGIPTATDPQPLQGQEMEVVFVQTSGGGWTVNIDNTNVKMADGFAVDGTDGKMTRVRLRWDETLGFWIQNAPAVVITL